MMLRERRSITFYNMKNDVVDIEGNMWSFRNITLRLCLGDRIKQKEDSPTWVSFSSAQETKIVEMDKLIRSLSNNITRLEMGNKVVE